MRTLVSLAFAVLFLTSVSQHAFAQQPGSGPGPAGPEGSGKAMTPENFKEIKTRILARIEERRTMLDKEKTCVEAAQNADELRKCRPERPMGMGPGGMQNRGPGQGQPPSSGK